MTTGRALDVLDDSTDLNGPVIDVEARAAWVVRTARLLSGRLPRLQDAAEATGATVARIHRLETGQLRDGRLVDAYEAAMELPDGSLRAAIDILFRTFPGHAVDRHPGPDPADSSGLSAMTQDLVARLGSDRHRWAGAPSAPGPAPGGRWLRWARALSSEVARGLPDPVALDLVEELLREMNRAVGHGYPTRYEALSLLRCGPYGHLVLEAARHALADPHVQVLLDMMSAVGEADTPEAVEWCLRLFDDPRDQVVVGAALALENMASTSADPRSFWARVVDPVTAAFNSAAPRSARHEWTSHLLRLAPRGALAHRTVRRTQALAPRSGVREWSRTRLNEHWNECERRARAITSGVGIPEQPVLARLLFDIAVGPFETRAVTSYFLLGALPALAVPAVEHVGELAETHPDHVIRARAARRLTGLHQGHAVPSFTDRWLAAGSPPRLRATAFYLVGAAGRQLPVDDLVRGVGDPELRGAALYAGAMAGHPVLAELARDRSDPGLRGAAGWWTGLGARITE